MIRENWRILLLVVLVLGSTIALFGPTPGDGSVANETESPTNLQYGLELSGGARVRAPLVGQTAEGVDLSGQETSQVQQTIANQLNISVSDVQTRPQQNAVEIYVSSDNRSEAEFRQALQAAGLEANNIRDGVTEVTRQTAVDVLNNKINEGGLTGGQATITRSPTGEVFVLVEVPNVNRSELIDLIGSRGQVTIVAGYPTGNGSYNRTPVIQQDGIAGLGTPTEGQGDNPPFVPVTLREEPAQRFANDMRQYGFTSQEGVGNCRWQSDREDYGYCLFTVVDGQVVYASSMGDDLARIIRNEEFVKDPAFRMLTSNMSDARELHLNLNAGALPTSLAIDEGTTYFLEPSRAQEFKLFSLITGTGAMVAVAFAVFLRYREPGVAIPMLITAAAEVYLMLGFAALVGLALDLSHIAGFIAVIGTGVDDLVIIADEILQGGEIRTGKVFASRFRKAFWVIGAAAATTIIAMSPLAVLSLGDLQGFAIVTIVGVLLGVLVTRPAYGNVLRNVVLD